MPEQKLSEKVQKYCLRINKLYSKKLIIHKRREQLADLQKEIGTTLENFDSLDRFLLFGKLYLCERALENYKIASMTDEAWKTLDKI